MTMVSITRRLFGTKKVDVVRTSSLTFVLSLRMTNQTTKHTPHAPSPVQVEVRSADNGGLVDGKSAWAPQGEVAQVRE